MALKRSRSNVRNYGAVRESVLDHIYIKDYNLVTSLTQIWPTFGDHAAVIIETCCEKSFHEEHYRRNWKNYTPDLLRSRLLLEDWNIQSDHVQDYWNELENNGNR